MSGLPGLNKGSRFKKYLSWKAIRIPVGQNTAANEIETGLSTDRPAGGPKN